MAYTNSSKAAWLAHFLHGKATDSVQGNLLMGYTWSFVHRNAFIEELLFCEYIKGRCTAEELFSMIDEIGTEKQSWVEWLLWCMHRWCSSNGRKTHRLRTLIKNKAPNTEWTHCFIHREAFLSITASREICSCHLRHRFDVHFWEGTFRNALCWLEVSHHCKPAWKLCMDFIP